MKALVALLAAFSLLSFGCSNSHSSNPSSLIAPPSQGRDLEQFPIPIEPRHPTVGLRHYTLVTDDPERDRVAADAVIQAKIGLPYAMQTKVRADFEGVLAPNFSFRGTDEFFDREGYIADRVGDPSKVRSAEYRNVVVQFITPDRALVTYSNLVEDEPGGPGAWKADMTWADILVNINGEWKYEIIHQIEFLDLMEPKK